MERRHSALEEFSQALLSTSWNTFQKPSQEHLVEFESSNLDMALMRLKLTAFQKEFDAYRFPLETLTFAEQQVQAPDWVDYILTMPKMNIDQTLLSNLEEVLAELHVDWDNELQISSLVHMILPESFESLRESYSLLIFMLMLRIQYQNNATLRYKIKRCACVAVKAFLKVLNDRKPRKRFSWWDTNFLICLLIPKMSLLAALTLANWMIQKAIMYHISESNKK